ncbi:MAG: ribonuclease P protein component [Alphaproteobacteria bacterium]|nr:MAG: ribonuclease P protein component [Alphaproteobacteria bacterium]
MRRRADFLRLRGGLKAVRPAFILQGRPRDASAPEMPPDVVRLGLTASRKVGGAVVRNRARRRLRALGQELLPAHGRPGWDYVLIARAGSSVSRPFDQLRSDLRGALDEIHRKADRAERAREEAAR